MSVNYLELRRISSIKHVLTVDATKTLVTSLVLSRLDYCNSLLSGVSQQLIDKLQKVQIALLDSFSKHRDLNGSISCTPHT